MPRRQIDPAAIVSSRPVGHSAIAAAQRDAGPRSLAFQCAAVGIPSPIFEHPFHPKRRWRFDCAWPDRMLAVEVEGGIWGDDETRGRHLRGRGFEADCQKYGEAAILGWTVLRVSTGMVDDGRALDLVERWWSYSGSST